MRARGHGDFWGKRVETGLLPSRRRQQTPTRLSTEMAIEIKESVAGISFAVKVHPRAKKNAITGEVGDALKLALTAPPVDGKANAACIDFFAKRLKVPHSSVTIASGQTSRNKVIRVAGLSAQQTRERLGI